MTKHIVLFAAAFIGGAIIALAVRAALFQPYAGDTHPVAAASAPPAHTAVAAASAPPHTGHDTVSASPPPAAAGTVNTICPICGMEVDPSIPPATYQGRQVGFGCRACPPIFARDPDRYGPAALANAVAGN